jgi:hypothetical protein
MTALLSEIFATSTGVLIKMQWLNFAKPKTPIPMQSIPDTGGNGGKQQTVTSSLYHANSTQYYIIRSNTKKLPPNAKPNVQENCFLGMLKPKMLAHCQREPSAKLQKCHV